MAIDLGRFETWLQDTAIPLDRRISELLNRSGELTAIQMVTLGEMLLDERGVSDAKGNVLQAAVDRARERAGLPPA